MSQADVDTILAIYEAVSRGDWDAASRFVHPDFELTPPDRSPITGTHRGIEAVRGFFDEVWAAFDEAQVDPEQIVDVGDRILVFLVVVLQPQGSTAKVELRVAHVWAMQDGKAATCQIFAERKLALEAAGLSEQDVRSQAG
jgi:uncharacterized protein